MTDRPQTPNASGVHRPTPHIGAYVLETLTLGMYGEPRHTLREYVQNSFDSIRTAQRRKFLAGRGEVTITITPDAITIMDNGMGVAASQAWATLTSIGASKKDRQHDAGFRGIGRLAGMAYCSELVFRTTFPEETTVTTVQFDCERLLKAMDPDEGGDIELAKLLAAAIRFEQEEDAARADDHFFEVRLQGIESAPEALTDANKVRDYLSETVPVAFDPEWSRHAVIEADYKSYFGAPMETIDVFVVADNEKTQIFKPYGDKYEFAKGTALLEEINFYTGDDTGYWGWVGHLSETAAVTDWRTRGLRVRVRNIQVDGTEIFESLFTEVKPSYGRFSTYYVGEIHVDPERVIPNARRDGFEETDEWINIKINLMHNICQPLALQAYRASQQGQAEVQKIVDDVDKLVDLSHRIADGSRGNSYDQVVDLMNNAKRLRRRASSALKVVRDLDDIAVDQGESKPQLAELQEAAKNVESVESQARMLIGQFLGEDERIAALKARLRQEIIQEVLDIVKAYVDSGTYQKIRRQLTRSG